MVWRINGPQGFESDKIRWAIVPYTRGHGLDLGCGARKAFPHMIGVDNGKDTELFGTPIKPDVRVDDCADLSLFGTASMDFVFSSHLLEHIEDYTAALAEWWRVIKPGGYLVLYLPHRELYPNIGQVGANPDHKHDFHPETIIAAMRAMPGGWKLLVNETRHAGDEYSFYQVFQKPGAGDPPVCVRADLDWPGKRACVVRYGGFGDMLQAAGLFPLLKASGYRVVVMTTPKGKDIIQHDPHVDEWLIQDDNQVPNHCLTEYWEHWATAFDKFINLSESIEGTLLAMPGRANHAWPHAVRHRHLNRNYHEWTAELAGFDQIPKAVFYPSAAEHDRMAELLGDGHFNVVLALAGSSVHKFYPGQDAVIAQVLVGMPEARIFLTGDYACKILEAGWEKEPRAVCLSGEQSIRETLTLAASADCVVGPETGVLNSVGFDPTVAKVVLLSHSSAENLTKHWDNVTALAPQGIPCHPCHQLHYDRRYCPQHQETGAALCQMSISPDDVVDAIHRAYLEWKANR